MPNRNYEKGRRFEHHAMAILKEQGYTCIRSAGSHGPWDVTAVNEHFVRFIQLKVNRMAGPDERKAILSCTVPDASCVRREIWFKESRKPLRTWLAVKGTFVEQ